MQSRYTQKKEESRLRGSTLELRNPYTLGLFTAILLFSIIRLKAENIVNFRNKCYFFLRYIPNLHLCLSTQTVQVAA